MALSTNTNFDAKHDVDYKTPMYLVHFDGETTDYCNHRPVSPTNTLKQYLVNISGLSQTVTPEEGKASISGVKVTIQDYSDDITALLATDTYFFHRRKTVIKAGYHGMTETDMLTIFTGWVTGMKLTADAVSYEFDITDPQKWLQRKVFRNATEGAPVRVSGNPINILLSVLMSTGTPGTNGTHDYLDAENGLGLSSDYINVTDLESIRDRYYPGDSHYMRFSITDKIKASDFVYTEILKVINAYPKIDGQGKFSIKPFTPNIAEGTTQSVTEANVIGIPSWDANLSALINEVFFNYDYDGSDFESETDCIDGTSVDNRGPGKKPLEIKSKGLHSSHSPGSVNGRAVHIIESRAAKVFGRFATPPTKIKAKCFFNRWLTEAGDIVPFTNSLLPDIAAGTRGYAAQNMEVVNRQVNWKEGYVTLELLDTGFDKPTNYGLIGETSSKIGSMKIS